MINQWPIYLCIILALWSANISGNFSAFSEFVMSALHKTKPAGGIEAMQHINRDVIKTQFVAGILSIAVLSAGFALYGTFAYEGVALVILVLAPLVYLPSVLLITVFGNVPMNNALARLEHESDDARIYWEKYVRDWTRLNHVRSLGSSITAGLYAVAAIIIVTSGQI